MIQKKEFIFSSLSFSKLHIFCLKIVDRWNCIFPCSSTMPGKQLVFIESVIGAAAFDDRIARYSVRFLLFDNFCLQKIIEVLTFVSNNFFFKPLLLSGFKNNQAVGFFVHNQHCLLF